MGVYVDGILKSTITYYLLWLLTAFIVQLLLS